MDLASLVGVIAGVGLVLASILMNSGLDLFINIPSAMIVLGGTLAATLIAFPNQRSDEGDGVVSKSFHGQEVGSIPID